MFRIRLKPRYLIDVSTRSTACRVLDFDLKMPIAIAPCSMHKMAHEEGEIATARGQLYCCTGTYISALLTIGVCKCTVDSSSYWCNL